MAMDRRLVGCCSRQQMRFCHPPFTKPSPHPPPHPHCPTPAAQYDDSPEALADALDALLEDPEFLDAVADEVGWGGDGVGILC